MTREEEEMKDTASPLPRAGRFLSLGPMSIYVLSYSHLFRNSLLVLIVLDAKMDQILRRVDMTSSVPL